MAERDPTTESVAHRGAKLVIEWVRDARGHMPGRAFFETLDEQIRAKGLSLFKMLGDRGRISNLEKFKSLGPSGHGLWEFKLTNQVRLLGDFRPGGRFMLAWGVVKKRGNLAREDIQKAHRLLCDWDLMEESKREQSNNE